MPNQHFAVITKLVYSQVDTFNGPEKTFPSQIAMYMSKYNIIKGSQVYFDSRKANQHTHTILLLQTLTMPHIIIAFRRD